MRESRKDKIGIAGGMKRYSTQKGRHHEERSFHLENSPGGSDDYPRFAFDHVGADERRNRSTGNRGGDRPVRGRREPAWRQGVRRRVYRGRRLYQLERRRREWKSENRRVPRPDVLDDF